MTYSRSSQFGARLGLLAMLLLFVAPLLSQGLMLPARFDQADVPAWLSELDCHSGSNEQPQAPAHEMPWAKCGYCTLLQGSPALSATFVASAALLPFAGAPLLALAERLVPGATPFPAAHPRAPPLSLS
ncbi:MAG TPA: DUF2946 domain-containing protein [Pseudomonas sp.]|nr:DUF2946 domain-containing protein [Pseudomonas sp.]